MNTAVKNAAATLVMAIVLSAMGFPIQPELLSNVSIEPNTQLELQENSLLSQMTVEDILLCTANSSSDYFVLPYHNFQSSQKEDFLQISENNNPDYTIISGLLENTNCIQHDYEVSAILPYTNEKVTASFYYNRNGVRAPPSLKKA